MTASVTRIERAEPADQLPTPSLTAQICIRIRADIIRGTLPPDLKLRIEVLCKRYEVGSSPVREALSQLAAEGLVDRLDNRGFRVKPASKSDFTEILTTRCWLETIALTESIEHGDRTWEEALVLALHRLSRAPRAPSDSGYGPDIEWEKLHRDFHRALLAACPSSHLLRYCDNLSDLWVRYRWISYSRAGQGRDVAAEHQRIVAAALDRRTGDAVAELLAHYRRTASYLDVEVTVL